MKNNMNNEQVYIEALNKTISVQQELIDFLKKEIQRLQSQTQTTFQNLPTQPIYQGCPNHPNLVITSPPNPLLPPFTVTCGSSLDIANNTVASSVSNKIDDCKSFGVVSSRRP